jgi:hypothetical protein
MSTIRRIALKSFGADLFDSQLEAVINGRLEELFSAEMQLMFFHPVSKNNGYHKSFLPTDRIFFTVGGQGIASGFRDAVSLAWRLAIACQSNHIVDHEFLLTGWYNERKQQLERSLASTVRNGNMVTSKSPVQILIRNWVLWFLQLIPSVKRWLELGPRSDGPIRYTHLVGMPFLPEFHGGSSFPQTYCVGLQKGSRIQFTDDVIFAEEKTKNFQIVVLLNSIDQLTPAANDLHELDRISWNLSPEEATFFIPRKCLSSSSKTSGNERLFRSATSDEFAQSELALGRPPPRGYIEDIMWQSTFRKRYVILRFDRFVFAICNTKDELRQAAKSLADYLPSATPP